MEKEIEGKINAFNYKYIYSSQDNHNEDNTIYDNAGYNKIVYSEQSFHKRFSELIVYDNIDHFIDKIDSYLVKYDKKNQNSGLFIGKEISNNLGLAIGDSLEVFFPTGVNLVTSFVPSKVFFISGIYNLNIFDFDSRYIIASNIAINDMDATNQLYYSDTKVIENPNDNNDDVLISAIQLEKKLYTSLSFILIIISCIMIFNIMIMVMIDKRKQIDYLNIIGLDNFNILKIMFIFNSLTSFVFTLVGYLLSELTIFCNYYYGLFDVLFESLPFKISPMNISIYEFVFIYLCINFLIISFSTFPYKLRKDLR